MLLPHPQLLQAFHLGRTASPDASLLWQVLSETPQQKISLNIDPGGGEAGHGPSPGLILSVGSRLGGSCPGTQKDVELLQPVQRTSQMITGDGAALLWRKAGREYCGWLCGDLIVVLQCVKELTRKMKTHDLSTRAWREGTTEGCVQTEGEEKCPKEGT